MPPLETFLDLLDAVPVAIDAEALYDVRTDAGSLRRANLLHYLDGCAGATTALVAEAPGWRGATVTGVPFMSVRELTGRSGYLLPPEPAATWELSASIVQKALGSWPPGSAVCWPIVPLHPFRAGAPHSNRAPRPAEVRAGAPVALELLRAFGIERVIAVGRHSERALAAAGIDAIPVRHPAQGGAGLFASAMARLDPGRRPTAGQGASGTIGA